MKRLFKAPTTVNLEITEVCNVKCRHCYNFWRDESMGQVSLDHHTVDVILDRLIEGEVFHVILSGGEPMARFDLLEDAITKLTAANISVSCNSNLMIVTDERAQRLARAGLDHILTSVPSSDPVMNDHIMNAIGSLETIYRGIRICRRNGIRVSANTVITRKNQYQVYDIGKKMAELGVQKLFVTRSVPPTYTDTSADDDYTLTPEEQKRCLDDAIRVRDEFGIMIGSLVSYPLCFLGDLDRYRDFVGRGCPAQSGHRMSINANGSIHACVHEEESYGNIFESPLSEVYQGRMRVWHDKSYRYEGCRGCPYADVCESGCSMSALGIYGDHAAKDPLFVGPHAFEKHFTLTADEDLRQRILDGLSFTAPERLRFRQEDGFFLVNARWGNSFPIETQVAKFLIEKRDSGASFTAADLGDATGDLMMALFVKDVVESTQVMVTDQRSFAGLSINPEALLKAA